MARIAAVAPDLFFASKIEATLRAAGHAVELVQAASAAGATADVLIVDLDAAGPEVGGPQGVPRLGFYSHVDVDTRRQAEEAGFDLVVPRSRMAREMPALVEGLLR
jgi:predicted secreted Zn-dependent protease